MGAVLVEYAVGGAMSELVERSAVARFTFHKNAVRRGVVAVRRLLPDGHSAEAIRLYEVGMNIADLACLLGISHGDMRE